MTKKTNSLFVSHGKITHPAGADCPDCKQVEEEFKPVQKMMDIATKVERQRILKILLDEGELRSLEIVPHIKPTHGNCCTCQRCGYEHDSCVCWSNRLLSLICLENKKKEKED